MTITTNQVFIHIASKDCLVDSPEGPIKPSI